MFRRVLVSLVLGLAVTFALIGLAYVLDDAGYESASRVILWPNSILQSLVPGTDIGTAEHPVLEGSPLNVLAFYASIPLGALVCGCLFFFLVPRLRWRP